MKCKIFYGAISKVDGLFNKWAKGKTLSSQVIIHTVPISYMKGEEEDWIAIVVYHPSTPRWDKSAE